MPDKKRVVIVDDEPLARKRLKKLLEKYGQQIEIVGEAANGKEGMSLIQKEEPEFVFLDIQMPLMNGFEMLKELNHPPFIVFTTAYDEYALKAFNENSIDYLLKPITAERLEMTIEKMENVTPSENNWEESSEQLKSVLQHLNSPPKLRSLTITSGDRIIILKLTEILLFKSEDKLTTVITTSGKEYFVTHSLSQLMNKLPEEFMRISRSVIINESEVADIRKGFNGKIVFTMNDPDQTKVSSGSVYTAAIKERWRF